MGYRDTDFRFFGERVRRVIRSQNVGDALRPPPARWHVAMSSITHRRVHLQQRAEPRIVVGAKRQMMRRDLAARNILMRREERDLVTGGNMQDVDPRHPAARAIRTSQSLRAAERRRSASRQTGWLAGITRHAQRLALVETKFVLGMESGAAAGVSEDCGDAFVFRHQQRAPVEDPMKTLMPAAPGKRSSAATSAAFSRVPPTQKGKIAMHAMMRARRTLSAKADFARS